MVKSYLRFEHEDSFGVVASGTAVLAWTPGVVLTPALENVLAWRTKTSEVKQVFPGERALVTTLAKPDAEADSRHSDSFAVGYADGVVRIWRYSHPSAAVCTMTGHRSGVSSLAYFADGSRLASGGQDTDIVVWDVVAEAGLFRLKGHTDAITGLVYLPRVQRLASCSKDSHIKLWNLDAQYCDQTLVGHRSEVWAIAADKDDSRVVSAGADNELLVWYYAEDAASIGRDTDDVRHDGADADAVRTRDHSTAHDHLALWGSVFRRSGEQARMTALQFHPTRPLLLVASQGKTVDVFRVRSADEALRKAAKRIKRMAERRAAKQASVSASDATVLAGLMEPLPDADEAQRKAEQQAMPTDQFVVAPPLRLASKLRALAVDATARSGDGAGARSGRMRLFAALSNNAVQHVQSQLGSGDVNAGVEHRILAAVDLPGHRSDVRALALSSDDSMLLSMSSSQFKIWNMMTRRCIRSLDSGYGLCGAFTPGNRHVVIGTKTGHLELYDIAAAVQLQRIQAHDAAIWSLSMAGSPAGGFLTGSGDRHVRAWAWGNDADSGALAMVEQRVLPFGDDVMAVRLSRDGRFIAVALLDCTVRVYFADSFKFFLSMYGHKLPVMALDISSDSTLLVTGSADKKVKLWGMDFGDCHRSLLAHADSVMSVAFVPDTHYFFTASKDHTIKYWDGDKFEQILVLDRHASEVWSLVVSSLGDFVVSAGHDRSMRLWRQTEDQVFLEEERDNAMEKLFEDAIIDDAGAGGSLATVPEPGLQEALVPKESDAAAKATLETVKAGERLAEALDNAAAEQVKLESWEARVAAARAAGTEEPPRPAANVLLIGLAPNDYVLWMLKRITGPQLDQALLVLSFMSACHLLRCIQAWLEAGQEVELACRCLIQLHSMHETQLAAHLDLRPLLSQLRILSHQRLSELKDRVGFNMAAMTFAQGLLEAESNKRLFTLAREQAAKTKREEQSEQRRRKKIKQR